MEKHSTEYDKYVRMFTDLMDDASIDLTPEEFDKFIKYLRDLLRSHRSTSPCGQGGEGQEGE